jgi:hypothetical protein
MRDQTEALRALPRVVLTGSAISATILRESSISSFVCAAKASSRARVRARQLDNVEYRLCSTQAVSKIESGDNVPV